MPMSASADPVGTTAHPSPQRARVSLAALFVGLIGGPAAWFTQLLANYALASFTCFPHDLPRSGLPPLWHEVWYALLVINSAGMLAALLAARLSWRNWNTTHGEKPGSSGPLMAAGEGRTRFIALVGMMAGLGFFVAVLFDTIALFVVPSCAG